MHQALPLGDFCCRAFLKLGRQSFNEGLAASEHLPFDLLPGASDPRREMVLKPFFHNPQLIAGKSNNGF